jgi:hypothetical protein
MLALYIRFGAGKTHTYTHLHIEKERQEEARKALLICTLYLQHESICHDDTSASVRRLVDCRFSNQHVIPLLSVIALAMASGFCVHSQKGLKVYSVLHDYLSRSRANKSLMNSLLSTMNSVSFLVIDGPKLF